MDKHDIKKLCVDWLQFKQMEASAQRKRRGVEDVLLKIFETKTEGTRTLEVDHGLKVKITTRVNRRVDSDLLQELAAEAGLSDHLSHLFRWKPEINMTAWKAADSSITDPLLDAITSSSGRPSFAITEEYEE